MDQQPDTRKQLRSSQADCSQADVAEQLKRQRGDTPPAADDAPPTLFELPDRTEKAVRSEVVTASSVPSDQTPAAASEVHQHYEDDAHFEVHQAHAGPPAGHVDPPSGNHSFVSSHDPFSPDSSAPPGDLTPVHGPASSGTNDRPGSWRIDPSETFDRSIAATRREAAQEAHADAAQDENESPVGEPARAFSDSRPMTSQSGNPWGSRTAVVSLLLVVGTISFLSGRMLHQPSRQQDPSPPDELTESIPSAVDSLARLRSEEQTAEAQSTPNRTYPSQPGSTGSASPQPPDAEIAGRPRQQDDIAAEEISPGGAGINPKAAINPRAAPAPDAVVPDTTAAANEDTTANRDDQDEGLNSDLTLGPPLSHMLQGPTESLGGQELPVIPQPPDTVISYRSKHDSGPVNAAHGETGSRPSESNTPLPEPTDTTAPDAHSIGSAIRSSNTPHALGDLLGIATEIGIWETESVSDATDETSTGPTQRADHSKPGN